MGDYRYVVTYQKDGKTKDRIFKEKDKAKSFYDRNAKWGNKAILSRVDQVSRLENILKCRIEWLGLSFEPLPWGICAISCIIVWTIIYRGLL